MTQPGSAIDFAALARALLDRAESLLAQWLPDGRREGHEWKARNPLRDDRSIGSFSVNLVSGAWADFADDDAKGGDLVSLYAYLHGLNNGQAARQLMRDLGWERSASSAAAPLAVLDRDARPEPPPDDGTNPVRRNGSKWRAVVPVPAHAPPPRFVFGYKDDKRGEWVELEAVRSWEYAFEGQRYGYVARFERVSSEGEIVKDTIPLTWCVDESDARGYQRWHWKSWDAPRPLYVPAMLLSGNPRDVPVVLVEGEKCAQAGHELLGHEFDFVSWPGGAKAWAKANWGWLLGRTVYLWPDCDAKRTRLTREEREAGADPTGKPLLPEARQPGVAAMMHIGSLLVADQACTVFICPIPKPGDVADGWDIADAIAKGWDAPRVRDFIRSARVFTAPDDAARAKARETISTPSMAGAGSENEPQIQWRVKLLTGANGSIKAVRENVVLALDGLPGLSLSGVPEVDGVIAFNEFTNDVVKLKPTPWGTDAGVWDEVDELEMGHWLTREHWLPSMPRGTLEEAVSMVAKRHRFHPVRDELAALRGTWDGVPRLAMWLRRCCMEEDEWPAVDPALQGTQWPDSNRLHEYLARVGTWLVMAICARVLTPGCKFDFMTIFEGPQGSGKSTLARLLGGDYFADTGLMLGDKDSYQNLQGILVYEWGELDSLNKSEVTKVKQFISSMKDRFRASFDRRAKDYPRQVVFVGTTNEDHYLTDPTGNRRMWPVRVTRQIDLDWFAQHRSQLFAEALIRVDAGERLHPITREQRQLFEPQQQQRQIENAIESSVRRYLYDEHQRVSMTGENGTLITEIATSELLTRLGISVDKQTAVVLRQATSALRHVGWVRVRGTGAGGAARPWYFKRPENEALALAGASDSPTRPAQGDETTGADDDCPF